LAVALLLLAFSRFVIFPSWQAVHLTNRSSQPLTGAMSTFKVMKQFQMFAALATASGG
jgi:hypothetical protein